MRAPGLLLWTCVVVLATCRATPGSYLEAMGKFNPVTPLNFTLGLAAGLEVDQQAAGPCLGAVGQVVGFVGNVETDIIALAEKKGSAGILAIHISELVTAIVDSVPFCQYTTLLPAFKQLTWQQVLKNAAAHVSALKTNGMNLANCKTNAYSCGQSIGKIVRYLFAWGVYAPQQSSGSFLSGLFHGLENTPNGADKCVNELNSLEGQWTQAIQDITSLLSGDVAASFALLSDFKSLLSAVQGDSQDCNLPQLGTIMWNMLTPQGVEQLVTNFHTNLEEIVQASAGFSNCGSNYSACGYSTGEVLRLVLGWGI